MKNIYMDEEDFEELALSTTTSEETKMGIIGTILVGLLCLFVGHIRTKKL